MFHKLRNNFITGMIIIFPLAITIIIVRYLVITLNSFVLNPLVSVLRVNPYLTAHSIVIAKFLIFIIVIFFISVIGWAANIIFLRKLFAFGEKLFIKVPLVGKVYSIIKEIGSAFLGQGTRAFFKKVVLIEYPRKGIYSIGFLTGEGRDKIKDASGRELLNIFVATTPNPTSGFYLLVPREEVTFLDIPVEEGLKLVVSSGAVTTPPDRGSPLQK